MPFKPSRPASLSSLRMLISPHRENTVLDTETDTRAALPIGNSVEFLRNAVGGELTEGARVLISGSPGGGKSRMSTQLCLELAREGVPTLSILTEEGAAQLKWRAKQLSADWPAGQSLAAMSLMHVDTNVYDVGILPELLMRQVLSRAGMYRQVRLIVLDSIQGHGLAAAATKTYAKVIEFARLCEENRIVALLLCQVNKRGDIAGPKALEHSVDVSMILRRAMRYSLLTVRKNRLGPPPLKPLPLRFNPVTTRLEPAPHCEPRPAMAKTFAGAGTGILEVQAVVAIPREGKQGRITAPSLPKREIEQLVTCIGGIPEIDFAELDYTLHCRTAGTGPYQLTFGLPLCMALIASYVRENVSENHLYLGEVDLFRHVRPLPTNLVRALRSTLDSGAIPHPVVLYLPEGDVAQFAGCGNGVKVVGCRTLEDAVFQTWPKLR